MAQIAGYAASTGQILNIGDVGAWLKEKHGEGDAEYARTILCMPIINGQRSIIGKCLYSFPLKSFVTYCFMFIKRERYIF